MTSSLQTVVRTARVESIRPPALSAPPSLESLAHALRQRWALALGLGALAGLLGSAIAWGVMPAQYTVQTLLQLAPRALHNGEGEDSLLNYQRSQTALVKSYGVIQGTLERPSVADLGEVRRHSDPTEWLAKALVTDTLLGPEIIRISLSGDRADDLAVLLNELVSVYKKESASKEEGRVLERMKQLKENYRECADKLRERRQTLLVREEEQGLDDPVTLQLRQTTTMQQLAAAQTAGMTLLMKRKDAEVELAGLRDVVKNPEGIAISDYAIAEELKLDPVMKKHFDQLTVIEGQIQHFRRVLPANSDSPDLQQQEKERDGVQKAMADYLKSMSGTVTTRLRSKQVGEAKDAIVKLERSLKSLKEQERETDGQIRRLERQVSSLRGAGRPLDKSTAGVDALRDEVTQMEVVLKKVGEEMGNLQAELPATARVTQLEPAKPPTARKRDRQLKAAGVTGFGLFGLAFLSVGLLEFRNRRVYVSSDVARGLGLNLLGTLPPLPEHAREQAPLLEAVDGVRTQLLHLAQHDTRRVVMVTSAIAGEGKTSLASQLSASLARAGHNTLLIDGDLRSPAAHRHFNLSVQPGLAEALRSEAPVEQLIHPTSVNNLAVLTAGHADRQAIDALARDGVRNLLDHLKDDYEFIILDACPVLPVADALLLGQHADAVVMAVRRNYSRLPAIHEAQRRLASLDIPMLGVVVLGERTESYGAERYLDSNKSQIRNPKSERSFN